jgi:hypothetical protein
MRSLFILVDKGTDNLRCARQRGAFSGAGALGPHSASGAVRDLRRRCGTAQLEERNPATNQADIFLKSSTASAPITQRSSNITTTHTLLLLDLRVNSLGVVFGAFF